MVSDKKNFVLRIDQETYRKLEKWAADEFRSVNGQIEFILSRAIQEKRKFAQKQQELPTDPPGGDKQ